MMNCFFNKENSKHGRAYRIFMYVFFGLLIAATVVFGFGYLVMLLWNAVMVELLGVHAISLWQSLGLLVLARILVGGFGHGHNKHTRGCSRRSRRDYEEWWKEVGEKSFQTYSEHGESKQ